MRFECISDEMDRKFLACVFFATLIIGQTFAKAVLEDEEPNRKLEKRVPIAVPMIYWGARVLPYVYRALVAYYGARAVQQAGVRIKETWQDRNILFNMINIHL